MGDRIEYTYQQTMKRMIAHALNPPGKRDVPQQKHRLTARTTAWLARRHKNAPTPYPVAMSNHTDSTCSLRPGLIQYGSSQTQICHLLHVLMQCCNL